MKVDCYVAVNGRKRYIKEISGHFHYLDLREEEIKNIAEIKGLENLTFLKGLDLSLNQLKAMHGLEHLSELEILRMDYNGISEISGIEHLQGLKELSLKNNKITRISGLSTLTRLQKIDLEGNKISQISGVDNLKRLKRLNLRNNVIRATPKDLKIPSQCNILFYDNPLYAYCVLSLGERWDDHDGIESIDIREVNKIFPDLVVPDHEFNEMLRYWRRRYWISNGEVFLLAPEDIAYDKAEDLLKEGTFQRISKVQEREKNEELHALRKRIRDNYSSIRIKQFL